MAIEHLDIQHFRNLAHVEIAPCSHLNVIVGKNGSGKTSLLETIFYLGSARSFRTPHSKQLITIGEQKFYIFAKYRKHDVLVSVGISKDSDSVKIKIANNVATNASQLAELIPIQLINPDVHKMLEEGPRYRRRFIEWGMFHVKPNYFSDWQQCRHILKQRNAALKQGVNKKELEYWNEALNRISETITTARKNYLEQLQPYLDVLIRAIPGLPKIRINLEYGWPKQKTLIQTLIDAHEGDRKKGFTQFGPHRADLRILAGEVRAKELVSRGQQKMLAAIMKIAQVKCLQDTEQGANTVLLVDDLPAELDIEYRQILLEIVANTNVQTFITATEFTTLAADDLLKKAEVFHVKHGAISKLDQSG